MCIAGMVLECHLGTSDCDWMLAESDGGAGGWKGRGHWIWQMYHLLMDASGSEGGRGRGERVPGTTTRRAMAVILAQGAN